MKTADRSQFSVASNSNYSNFNKVIENQYKKWNKFDNFVNYAEKKELKDWLKEFDPPPLKEYVGWDVYESIKNQNKKQKSFPEETKINPEVSKKQKLQHMRDLYGI